MRLRYLTLALVTPLMLLAGLASTASAAPTAPAKANPAAQDYGAIAYSPNSVVNTYATALANTKKNAEWAATLKCEKREGSHCGAYLWFHNGWGALAASSNGAGGTGWGTTEVDAASAAIRVCQQHGGVNCNVIAEGHTPNVLSSASGGPGPETTKGSIPFIPKRVLRDFKKAIGPAISCGISFTKIGPLVTDVQRLVDLSKGDLDALAREFVWGWACLDQAPPVESN